MTHAEAVATWWRRQGLAGTSKGNLASVIASTGWLRTLGGVDAYLAARARRAGMKRRELDAAVAAGELRVVPAARGCIYLVPASVVADLMAWNAPTWHKALDKDLGKIGKKRDVIEKLAPAVVAALAKQPLTTDALRKALGDKVVSFGDAGKKIGLSSPLPLALRLLELEGKVERTLDGGRLDTERYLWKKADGKPAKASKDPFSIVIGAFLAYAGPATLAQIAAWSGSAQRDVKAALEKLGASAVAVDGIGEAWTVGEVDAKAPKGVALLAFEDNYLVNHGLGAVTDGKHHEQSLVEWGQGKSSSVGQSKHVLTRTIVVDGYIAGFWEVDPKTNGAVWWTFDAAPKALAATLDELTADTARFLLEEIGHARSFSLDTMDDVQDRADRIAKLRGGVAKKRRA